MADSGNRCPPTPRPGGARSDPHVVGSGTNVSSEAGVLKTGLQKQGSETMNHYADAKTALISEMTARAEAWAVSTGWSP